MANTTIRRIPTSNDVSSPVSLRPSGVNPAIDVAAPFRGAQDLAQGVATLGADVQRAAEDVSARQRTADVSAADAQWLKGSLDLGNEFQARGDFQKFEGDAAAKTAKLRDAAASLITDPQTRQAWMAQTEQKRITFIDAVKDHGKTLADAADRGKLTDTIDTLSKVIADPMTPAVTREQARQSVAASIAVAQGSGLVDGESAAKLRRAGLQGADEQLAMNRARLGIQFGDPQHVLNGMGIPTEAGGAGILAAATQAQGGTLQLDPQLAKVTADLLGDSNFPSDPKLAAAYLSDPAKAEQYQTAAVAMLNDRYKGDLTATVIALDPKGGTTLADQWVKSKHNEDVLPADVRNRYRQAMTAFKPAIAADRIPIQAHPGLDLNTADPGTLDRFELLQTSFGEAVPLMPPAAKSQHVDGTTITLDTSALSDERKAQLVQMASAMGFTGIGVGKDTLELDGAGPPRTWGTAAPWAKDALAAHAAGTPSDVPLLFAGVSPDYAALSFDQRLQLAGEAKQAMKERSTLDRASLETTMDDAPAAIANTGKYDGDLPDATRFVQAYGAADGIQRYRAFETSLDTARTIFGFRAEPTDQIMAAVAAAAPQSSGQGAALEQKRFEAISAAAEQTIKARNADPAGYTMNVFPKVAEAFQAAQDANSSPWVRAGALNLMAAAQKTLGIEDPQLLPVPMATAAVATFNDASKPAAERTAGVASLLLSTNDEGQQLAIYKQLLKTGLPEYTQGAIAAMMRGDAAGSQNLMRATMIDPDKLAGQLPGNVNAGSINEAVQRKIFDENQIGDIIYGVTSASTDNLARMRADSTLIDRDVKLHLIDGSAGGDVNKAVDLAIKDMYGDVVPITGGGVKITLPRDENPAPMLAGFGQVKPAVKTALQEDMANGMIQIAGQDVNLRSTGMAAIYKAGIDNAVNLVMSEGYFINAGQDQYQFFNPYTGAVIGGADGKPVTFTKADVLAAGQGVDLNTNRTFPGMGGR